MGSFPANLRKAEINGTSLAYADIGTGQAVVMIHGTSQDIRTWRYQADAFAARFRTIIYSRRYARPNEDISPGSDDQMQTHVDDLLALIRHLGLAPAHLLGSSWGGFIALLAAVQEPGAVKSLVLCEPPVIPLFISNNPGAGELARLFIRRPVDAVRIARFGLRVIEPTIKAYRAGDIERGGRTFGVALLGKERFAALPEETVLMISENESAEVAQMLGAGFPPLHAADVRSIKAPSLIVAGEESGSLFRFTLPKELERLLPNATRIEIPEASHLMHEDNPSAFNDAVLSFLARSV